MLSCATFAKFMLAVQLKEFRFRFFIVAYLTCQDLVLPLFFYNFFLSLILYLFYYFNATLTDQLLLLHQAYLINDTLFIFEVNEISTINYSSRVGPKWGVIPDYIKAEKAKIPLAFHEFVSITTLHILFSNIVNDSINTLIVHFGCRILHSFWIEAHHYHSFDQFIPLSLNRWADIWHFFCKYGNFR